ncbi:MAG: glycosyltransferase [Saprospiraceae bacterium]|nr:glycosyltransferase [Saprospiraceae bacterium]
MAEAYHVSKHIVYLGETGFPYGLAPIQRQILISLGLVDAGVQVLVISNKGVFPADGSIQLSPRGSYRGIEYIYTSGETHRRPQFWLRNWLKIKGFIKELTLLVHLKRTGKIDAAIVASMRFQSIFYYFLISRLLRFKVLLSYVEYSGSISTRSKWRDRVNDFLIDRYGIGCADAVLPISHFLQQHVSERYPQQKQLKVPIVGDFSTHLSAEDNAEVYFLYCGSANYYELIDFIIQAFEKLDREDAYLHLVVSGDAYDINRFQSRLGSSSKKHWIRVFSRIPFTELLKKYRQAAGLLIPLRNTIQDVARFPHKIGEYLASGVPIITTNFGEIAQYFHDGTDAIICDQFNPVLYAEKMKYVLQNPVQAKQIGEAGRKLGSEKFDYRIHGSALSKFILTL